MIIKIDKTSLIQLVLSILRVIKQVITIKLVKILVVGLAIGYTTKNI